MIESRTDVQQRYQAALDALAAKLERDRYVLAVVVYGSVVRGEAWEKSDIDLEIIVKDGSLRAKRGMVHYWLTEDGINISAASEIQRQEYRPGAGHVHRRERLHPG